MEEKGSIQISHSTIAAWMLLTLVSLYFYYFPGIDLWAARELYLGHGQFLLSNNRLSWFFHGPVDMILKFGFLLGLIGYLIILMFKIKISRELHQKLIFIFTSAFVSELFIINFVLKNHWGRVRPVHLPEFGGGFGPHFTPAWRMAHECAANCSFTSGHAGIAACLGLLVVLVPQRLRAPYMVFVVLFTAIVAFMRMARGAHFLSDVVISPLIGWATAAVVRDIVIPAKP